MKLMSWRSALAGAFALLAAAPASAGPVTLYSDLGPPNDVYGNSNFSYPIYGIDGSSGGAETIGIFGQGVEFNSGPGGSVTQIDVAAFFGNFFGNTPGLSPEFTVELGTSVNFFQCSEGAGLPGIGEPFGGLCVIPGAIWNANAAGGYDPTRNNQQLTTISGITGIKLKPHTNYLLGVLPENADSNIVLPFNYRGFGFQPPSIVYFNGEWNPNSANLNNPGGLPAPAFAFDILGNPAGVPEPAEWALLMLGFLGVGAMLRLRRKGLIPA
jgi:hypothetical protein